mgnify:CR=1 FL=1
MSDWVLNAVRITGNLYRVDMRGDLVQHGVDPVMTPKIEGRAVAMVDEKTLQAMRDEIGEVLAGRPTPTPVRLTVTADHSRPHGEVTIADIDPEDLV